MYANRRRCTCTSPDSRAYFVDSPALVCRSVRQQQQQRRLRRRARIYMHVGGGPLVNQIVFIIQARTSGYTRRVCTTGMPSARAIQNKTTHIANVCLYIFYRFFIFSFSPFDPPSLDSPPIGCTCIIYRFSSFVSFTQPTHPLLPPPLLLLLPPPPPPW